MAARREVEGSLGVFASELRYARTKAGFSQDELASEIAYSSSLVAMVETGKRMPTRDFAERCDKALNTNGLLTRMWPLVSREAVPSWFREWVEIEREASSLRSWDPLLISGLLQIPEYAHEVLRRGQPAASSIEIEQGVAARMERQRILDRDNPPLLLAVLDEGALRRKVASPDVMAKQLAHLLEIAQQPKSMIQVVPAEAGAHAGMAGTMIIASFDDGPDVAYLDTAVMGQLVERPDDVAQVARLYDTLRAEALPCGASARLIEEVMGTWTF